MDEPTIPYQYIEEVQSTVLTAGDPIDIGCKESKIEKYKSLAREINPGKPITVVSGWIWLDLEVNAEQFEAAISLGYAPAVLNINNVIYDDRKKFKNGTWVCTSLLKQFHSPALFETKNTFYILVGVGSRKAVHLDALGFV
jgi:hypothetical protein